MSDSEPQREAVARRPKAQPQRAAEAVKKLERMEGIEPSCSGWEPDALPLSYTRKLRSWDTLKEH